MSISKLRKYKRFYNSNWILRLVTIMICILMTMIISLFVPITIMFVKLNDNLMSIIIFSVGFLLSIFGMTYLYRFWYLVSPDIDKHRKIITTKNIVFFISLFLIFIVYQLVVSFITADKTISKPSYEITWITIGIIWWFNGIVAPILEEITMKGIFLSIFFRQPRMYNYISENIDPRYVQMIAGVIVSAMITTMLHGDNSSLTMIGFLLNGIITAVLYYKTKHVFYPILFHMINNNLVVLGLVLYHIGLIHI